MRERKRRPLEIGPNLRRAFGLDTNAAYQRHAEARNSGGRETLRRLIGAAKNMVGGIFGTLAGSKVKAWFFAFW
jgi:hypothetical protein